MRRLLPLAAVAFVLGCNGLTIPNEIIVADTSTAVKKEKVAMAEQAPQPQPAQPPTLPMPGAGTG